MDRLCFIIVLFVFYSCSKPQRIESKVADPLPADYSINKYLHLLKNKRVALLINHSAVLNNTSLLDTLMSLSIPVKKIFVPEHGFRGTEQAGQTVANSYDSISKLPIISLYGAKLKPSDDDLRDIDVLVYDIQDVGVRFYTYISTLFYAMQAAAERDILFLVLDRPNPNGDYVDGPVLDLKYKSFVGMLPLPIVYGMTSGELALMINGEAWLLNRRKCKLRVVKCRNYTHQTKYELPLPPSPNLRTYRSLRLYPSLCLFEATNISVGRGTPWPFMVAGGLDSCFGAFRFRPQQTTKAGVPLMSANKDCYGLDLREDTTRFFTLKYLIHFYSKAPIQERFVTNKRWFDQLAGNDKIRLGLLRGVGEEQLKESWAEELKQFKSLRKKYLIYPD